MLQYSRLLIPIKSDINIVKAILSIIIKFCSKGFRLLRNVSTEKAAVIFTF